VENPLPAMAANALWFLMAKLSGLKPFILSVRAKIEKPERGKPHAGR
jgi:hypothetical protein